MAAAGCNTSHGNAARNKLTELLNLGNETLSRCTLSVCNHARTRQEAAETLETIVARANRKIDFKEYVGGHGWLNEEIGSLAFDGQFIANVFTDIAQDKLIEFPSDVYNFQSCHSNAVMCCWVQDRHNENAINNGN